MRKSHVREYFESLVVAVVLALFVRTWVFQAFKIPTGSMENNLLVGDHLLVNKMVNAPAFSSVEEALLPGDGIERGDVIVFKYPEQPERDFIKRVIGLPGEKLEMHQKRVFIEGKPIDEPYVQFIEPPGAPGQTSDLRSEYGPVTVPANQYFMMGDNRDNSEDSRYWGFMPGHYVKGQAVFIYFSVGESMNLLSGIRWSRLLDLVR